MEWTLACCLEDLEHALSPLEKPARSRVGYLPAATHDYIRSTYDAVTPTALRSGGRSERPRAPGRHAPGAGHVPVGDRRGCRRLLNCFLLEAPAN